MGPSFESMNSPFDLGSVGSTESLLDPPFGSMNSPFDFGSAGSTETSLDPPFESMNSPFESGSVSGVEAMTRRWNPGRNGPNLGHVVVFGGVVGIPLTWSVVNSPSKVGMDCRPWCFADLRLH
jgi:hypothetical protein